jgi:hypothetical protein
MRGQVSVEFMTLVFILIAIFTFFLWDAASLDTTIIGIKSDSEAKRLCDRIAFEINSAVRAGDGYKRNFYVEENLYGISDFNITVGEYSVFIDWNKKSTSSSISTKNIAGDVSKGWNLIKNNRGNISVS